jgi:hypothetical protein
MPMDPTLSRDAAMRYVLLLFSPVIALGASGAVRATLGVSLTVGLVVGAAGTVAVAFALLRRLPRPTGMEFVALGLGGLAAAVMVALLHNEALGALVTVGGGDAGNHVSLQHEFVEANARVYQGFVALYAVAHWLGAVFGLDDFGAFSAATYVAVLCVPFAAAAGAGALLNGTKAVASRRATLAGTMLFAILLGACAVRLWGPWLHYQQADGFYAHLFGLVPTLLGWLAYAASERRWVRLGVVVAWVGFQRFTYGLNLGDWLLTAAALAALEAYGLRDRKRRLTWALLAGAVPFLAAAFVAYRLLLPLKDVSGAVVAPDVPRMLLGQVLALLALIGAGWFVGAGSAVARRLVLPPLLFGAVALAVQALYVVLRWPRDYYFYKYNLHPAVWLSVALVAVAPAVVARLIQMQIQIQRDPMTRGRWLGMGGVAASVPALVLVMSAIGMYWSGFRERAFDPPPYTHIDALSDPALLARAREVLRERRALPGGVLDPSWPRSNFLNASLRAFHAFNEGWPKFVSGEVTEADGTCVFWLEGDEVKRGYEQAAVHHGENIARRWRELLATPDKVCVPHARGWLNGGASLHLCHRCGPR